MSEKKPVNVRVGSNIKTSRKRAGYTQIDLAGYLGITPNHLSAIERGAVAASLEVIDSLSRLFGQSVDSFFVEEFTRPKAITRIQCRLERLNEEQLESVDKVISSIMSIIRHERS